ncbi:C13 family peptidase [Comamonas humi]
MHALIEPVRRPWLRHAALAVALLCAMGAAPAQPAPGVATPAVVLPDGGRYHGGLKDGLLEGEGRIEWSSTRRFEGRFHRGHMDGPGKLTVAYGVYEGQFHDGELNGPGRYAGQDGTRYEGGFRDGEYDGQGVLTDSFGLRYQGSFRQGQFTGPGRLTDADGLVISGPFKNFLPDGVMEAHYPGGTVFKGEMLGNRPKGEGELRLPDGTVLHGDFSAGMPAQGTVAYPNGDRYTGPLVAGKAHGSGVLARANGDVYRGEFARGEPQGRGTLTPAKGGPAQSGSWRGSRRVAAVGAELPEEDDSPAQAEANNQAALYAQNALLAGQMATLRPHDPAQVEMYALFVAGDGTQEVFRREVEYVNQAFARRFDTQGRSLVLANSRSSVRRLPLATNASIERALGALAQHMDRERDLLFVFLTSHGSQAHELQIGMRGMRLPQLSAQKLADLLKASGIRKRVVVVSACYSGGFIAPLQGPTTWVITASRADRTSFGCADENDFTYFGRALFQESLPRSSSLTAAFGQASRLVRQWEQELAPAEGGDAAAQALHSEPQMAVQPAFQAEVDAWFAAHAPAVGSVK